MKSRQLRLLIFDSCPVTSAGLKQLLASRNEIDLISEARVLLEATTQLKQTQFDVIVMDLDADSEDSCDAVRHVRTASTGTKILIFSAQSGDGEILRALNAGAAGYMLKSADREEIIQTIHYVAARERYIAPAIAQRIAEYIGKDTLTAREIEVLSFVREGWRNRQIAKELRVAETTVNFHIKNTLAKLRANDRTHAVTIAMKRGLLSVLC